MRTTLLLERNVGREAFGAVPEPFHGDALLAQLLWAQLIEIRHEDFQPLLRCHAAVPVAPADLIVHQVEDQINAGIVRGVDQDGIDRVHAELAEAECASFEAKEVVPLSKLVPHRCWRCRRSGRGLGQRG